MALQTPMPPEASAARRPKHRDRQPLPPRGTQGIAPGATVNTTVPSLDRSHPLAVVAARHCDAHPGHARRFGFGQVACGACWELAIRDDERVVVVFGLPRELVVDPLLVDDIAVERACHGDRVRLTKVERRAAVARLLEYGLTPSQAAARLGMSGSTMSAVVADGGVAA